jgi:hypothetical protein
VGRALIRSRSRTLRQSSAAAPLSGGWRRWLFGSARTGIAVTQKLSLVLCGQTVHLGRSLCDCHQVEPALAIHCILPRTVSSVRDGALARDGKAEGKCNAETTDCQEPERACVRRDRALFWSLSLHSVACGCAAAVPGTMFVERMS